MAMSVVLVFEKDSEAIDFALANVETTGREVKGLYKHPTLFCNCTSGKKIQIAFTKGLKYGWWVCAQCRKPRRMYWENIWKDPGIGKNLINQYIDFDSEEKQSLGLVES